MRLFDLTMLQGNEHAVAQAGADQDVAEPTA
jgi:hypothetical protein